MVFLGVWQFDPTFASKIFHKNIKQTSLTDLLVAKAPQFNRHRRSESVEVGTFTSEARKKEPFTEAAFGMMACCHWSPKDREVKSLKCWYCVLYFDLSFFGGTSIIYSIHIPFKYFMLSNAARSYELSFPSTWVSVDLNRSIGSGGSKCLSHKKWADFGNKRWTVMKYGHRVDQGWRVVLRFVNWFQCPDAISKWMMPV